MNVLQGTHCESSYPLIFTLRKWPWTPTSSFPRHPENLVGSMEGFGRELLVNHLVNSAIVSKTSWRWHTSWESYQEFVKSLGVGSEG